LKNLDHARPGRLSKRWEEKSKLNVLKIIEEKTKVKFDYAGKHAELLSGPNEVDIVETALEDVMTSAARSIGKLAKEKNISLRMAGYLDAIQKVHACYIEAGITV
jgi:glutamate dehydrogenase (NAD(P)+)